MNHIRLLSALMATSALAGLAACNRPEVVTVPVPVPAPAPVVVPGPAGPPGPAGTPGFDGNKGEPGKNADGTTIIVVPAPASSPSR